MTKKKIMIPVIIAVVVIVLVAAAAAGYNVYRYPASARTLTDNSLSEEQTLALCDEIVAREQKDVLVAYLSHSGTTRGVAEALSGQIGADLFEMRPKSLMATIDEAVPPNLLFREAKGSIVSRGSQRPQNRTPLCSVAFGASPLGYCRKLPYPFLLPDRFSPVRFFLYTNSSIPCTQRF